MIDASAANNTNNNGEENAITGFVLVEIVSALNVPNVSTDKKPDPYVSVKVGDQDVHRTDPLINTQFPIWSLDTGSMFLLESAVENSQHVHVQFRLKEYESFRSNPTLGTLEISMKELLEGTGARKEFPLEVPQRVLDLYRTPKLIRRQVSCMISCLSLICVGCLYCLNQ